MLTLESHSTLWYTQSAPRLGERRASAMQTAWDGFGCPERNVITTEVLFAKRRKIQLSATPGVVTPITFPGTVKGVLLWTTAEVGVGYAIDATPNAMGTSLGTTVDWSEFDLGDILLPNQWQ